MRKSLLTLSLLATTFLFSQNFIEKIVDNNFNDAIYAISIDLDGDGDKDIVGTAYTADEVAWYENDGNQNFTKHVISTTIDGAIYVSVYDPDGDGDLDLLVNAYNGNAIYGFRNNGSQNFSQHTIDNNANGSNYNTVGNFDTDPFVEFVSANSLDNDLAFYKFAIGSGGILYIVKTVIDTNFTGASSVEAIDLDGDGDLDLLATAFTGDEIAWYKNDGSANFTKHSIDNTAIGALTTFPIDFDADGDIDFVASISGRLLATGGDEVAWYENDGSENFTKHSVDASADYASFGQAVDLDNDGDLDIVASVTNSNGLRWYESNGATPPTFITHVVLGGPIGDSYSIDIDDMDGDGWQDILVAAPGNNSIRIFDNIIGSTFIPDTNFEVYLEANAMGNGITNDQKVFTANIENVTILNVSSLNIADLTGIEDFTALINLNCISNSLTNLDIDSNTLLERLNCSFNNLTSINVINNVNLITLYTGNNNLLEIDASQNAALTQFNAQNNPNLNSLNIKNGNNSNIADSFFRIQNTPNLRCIEVDNEAYSTTAWITYINTHHYFNNTCETIWTGTPTSAWSNLAPIDGSKAVIIEEPYNTSLGNIDGVSLLIRSGTGSGNGSLTIDGGTYVNIKKDLINNSNIVIENEGTFVQTYDDATVTGTGTYEVKVIINEIPVNSTNPSQSSRYTYFSSPVQGATLNVFNSWAAMNSLWSFDQTIQNWSSESNTAVMNKGKGYIVRNIEDAARYPFDGSTAAKGLTIFNGAFNNGMATHTLAYNTGGTDDDSILVGNPYPSAISTAQLFIDNTSVASLHFWRHAEGADVSGNFNEDYAVRTTSSFTHNAPEHISTGQGFFAVASASGDLVFRNNMRITNNNNTFLRPIPQNTDRAWFNITTSTGVEAQTAIGFIPNCSDEFDNQHDAKNMYSGSYLDLYTNGAGSAQNLVIQARAPLNNTNSIIPLGFNMTNATITNLTISLDNFENFIGYDILLKDIQENIIHDIRQSDYNFTINQTGSFDNRFEILFNRSTASVNNNIIDAKHLIISNQENGAIKVNMRDGSTITHFKAYDILGKSVIDIQPNQHSFDVNTGINQATVLFIKATLENGQVLSKKFIKL